MTWAATNAKAKFSEMLDKAETEGPQLVRRRKREFVLMTREQHEALAVQPPAEQKPFISAWDALKPSSGAKFDMEFPRIQSKPRAAKF